MGKWSMGTRFWIKYFIALPLLLVLYIPYWLIRPFSKEMSEKYALYIDKKTSFIYEWIES